MMDFSQTTGGSVENRFPGSFEVAIAKRRSSRAQSEAQFQNAVIKYAKLTGWLVHHHYNSRRSEPGWPDLALLKPAKPGFPARLVFAELKTDNGKLTAAQKLWLDTLTECVETYIWRPADWGQIEFVLGMRKYDVA